MSGRGGCLLFVVILLCFVPISIVGFKGSILNLPLNFEVKRTIIHIMASYDGEVYIALVCKYYLNNCFLTLIVWLQIHIPISLKGMCYVHACDCDLKVKKQPSFYRFREYHSHQK